MNATATTEQPQTHEDEMDEINSLIASDQHAIDAATARIEALSGQHDTVVITGHEGPVTLAAQDVIPEPGPIIDTNASPIRQNVQNRSVFPNPPRLSPQEEAAANEASRTSVPGASHQFEIARPELDSETPRASVFDAHVPGGEASAAPLTRPEQVSGAEKKTRRSRLLRKAGAVAVWGLSLVGGLAGGALTAREATTPEVPRAEVAAPAPNYGNGESYSENEETPELPVMDTDVMPVAHVEDAPADAEPALTPAPMTEATTTTTAPVEAPAPVDVVPDMPVDEVEAPEDGEVEAPDDGTAVETPPTTEAPEEPPVEEPPVEEPPAEEPPVEEPTTDPTTVPPEQPPVMLEDDDTTDPTMV